MQTKLDPKIINELAERHENAVKDDNAFHMTLTEMKVVAKALRYAADKLAKE